jgi:hypothetical protein
MEPSVHSSVVSPAFLYRFILANNKATKGIHGWGFARVALPIGCGELMHRLFLVLFVAVASEAAAEPKELITAPHAILCLGPDNLDDANRPPIAKDQNLLRGLGCMRTHSGIPATLLDGAETGGSWKVRVRPQGISGGVTMWGRPSSFTLPAGSQLRILRAAR